MKKTLKTISLKLILRKMRSKKMNKLSNKKLNQPMYRMKIYLQFKAMTRKKMVSLKSSQKTSQDPPLLVKKWIALLNQLSCSFKPNPKSQ